MLVLQNRALFMICKVNLFYWQKFMQNSQLKSIDQILQYPNVNRYKKSEKQFIHESPNIDMLKKMFVRTKNRSQYIPNEQSLLFNRQSSLAVLKAYHRRKRYQFRDSVNYRDFDNLQKDLNMSTIDSPEKYNFKVQALKYDIQRNSLDRDLYQLLIERIEQSKIVQQKLFPVIKAKNSRPLKNEKAYQNQDFVQKNRLPSLNQKLIMEQEANQVQAIKMKVDLKTNEPISNFAQKLQIGQSKKSSNRNDLNEQTMIVIAKNSLRTSLQNPEIVLKKSFKNPYGTISECKFKKQCQEDPKQTIIPELKNVQSVKSLFSQKQNIRRGYMHSHPQAKLFIKWNREKLKQQAKIKQFLISGITATSYAVIDTLTMTPIAYRNFNKKIQIASITKVMTCYLCLLACKKYKIDSKKHMVRISDASAQMNGTSAQLQIGDIVSLEDLIYALMLPSGNDASVAIAESIGKVIQRNKKRQTKKTYYETFIAHMNLLSRQLKLDQDWRNSSGLPQNPNHSTTHAISILAAVAMMDDKFRKIVSCKQYEAQIKNQRYGLKRKLVWKNTNKLLEDGWQGVKTGTTDPAGHCLMAKKQRYLISVFNSGSNSKRYTQCVQLYDFVKTKQRYLFPEKWD